MAGKLNTEKPESLQRVINCIEERKSFILEAGAGSGKTWSLIESIRYILEKEGAKLERQKQQIACITYTNVAKDEISHRLDNNPLVLVLTIHEFLWYVTKNYQKQLKEAIVKYNNSKSKKPIEDIENKITYLSIDYSQFGRDFERGRISHEDVLELSASIFNKYTKISKIVANKFPYIFIDEYQDTEERTINLLLNDFLAQNSHSLVLGFFGDSMQKIYNTGIGKIKSDKLTTITKEENFRCSIKVIGLLNQIRPDLIQKPAGNNLEGQISFFHCNAQPGDANNYSRVLREVEKAQGWDLKETKVLFLTHKGIANKLGYENLLATYDKINFYRERLLNAEDPFSDFLLNKVEKILLYYDNKDYGNFKALLGIEGFRIKHHSDKLQLQTLMKGLHDKRLSGNVDDVIKYVYEKKLLIKSKKISDFIDKINLPDLDEKGLKLKEFYESLMQVKYMEIIQFNKFLTESTPFSTKHGVKGAEFKNVLVVIDDDSWNQYKFNDVFSNNKKNAGRYERTLNLLYVCCSRAKDKLAVLSLSPMEESAMSTIKHWFGEKNVFDVAQINN